MTLSVDAAGAAYRAARADAATMSGIRLRRYLRTLLRSRSEGHMSATRMVFLRAVADEYRARGGELAP